MRERWWLVALAVGLATLAALVYVVAAPKVYQAEADLLITPVSAGDDSVTVGLGLITESNDPTQVLSTASRLITTTAVAQDVKQRLELPDSASEILDRVTVEPIAQSNLVSVLAEADSAAGAAALANGFAESAVRVRTAQLRAQIDALVPRLRSRLAELPVEERTGSGSLGARLAELEALRAGADPTIRVAAPASAPGGPSSPQPRLAILAGILGGLILGVGAAFASQALDPRLRREEQLRELFRLPVLARVPKLPGGDRSGPLPPHGLTAGATEAYRTLRTTLAATLEDDRRSVLLTSSAAGEGKTTTAINLAHALAQAGNSVILLEGDLRRPAIGAVLGVRPVQGIGAVLANQATFDEALFTTPEYGDNLFFLLAERTVASLADRLSLPSAEGLIEHAESIADFVVVDSPPLPEVVDALPLAQRVGAVVIVTRFGKSRLNRLTELGEMLSQSGVVPVGLAVVGVDREMDSAYLTDADLERPSVPGRR